MSSELTSYLTSSIPINLSPTPYDSFEQFVLTARARARGSVQPPGPGTDEYLVKTVMEDDGLHYTVDVHWEPWVKEWLIHSIPPNQVTHRSRLLAIASSWLQVNEIHHRLEQTREFRPALEKAMLTDRQQYEIFHIVADTTLKYMTIDPDWIRHYIKEHERSSLGGGFKWSQAYGVSISEWSSIKDQLTANMEEMIRQPGYWNTIHWYGGIRARAEELTSVSDHYSPPTMTRSRIIVFHPMMSLWTVFIPQKAAWYAETLKKVEQVIHLEPEVHYPYVMGGQIYILAKEYFDQGLRFQANDGKAWDSSVGLLVGKYCRPFLINFQGYPMMPTGETFTSLLDTVASLIAIRRQKGKWIVLGDDMNSWGGTDPKVPYIERQPADTKYKWILGVRFDIDPDRPRISGIKMSMDRSTTMIPTPMIPYSPHEQIVARKRDPRTRVAWAGLFHGWFGGKSLIDALAETPPGEYISAGELIERRVEEEVGTMDPYAWAEELGVKKVFVTG